MPSARPSRLVASFVALLLLAAAGQANITYVSSLGSDEVLRYESATGQFVDVFIAAASGGLGEPHGILERASDVLVASFADDRILRYDRSTGAFLGTFADGTSGLDAPTYLLLGADGLLYVSSQESDEILRYDASGALVSAFVSAGSGGLDGPSGFAFGPDGRLYVAGRYSANVIAYDGSTGAFDQVVADSGDGLGFGNTFGLAFAGNGDCYVVSASAVFRLDPTGGVVTTIAVPGGPIGLETEPAGDVLVATGNNLRRIASADDSLGPPLLTGGVISTLNFFHLALRSPPPVIPAMGKSGILVLALAVLAVGVTMVSRLVAPRH